MNEMKFSILIAHYNNWNFFKECYSSICNQTFQNFEIIIVDDYSTDDSYSELQNLAQQDSRIKLYKNTENKKVGYTKNRCIEEANGDICGFLDPDDLLSPDAIEKSIKEYSDPTIVATYSKIKLIDKNSQVIGDFKHSKKIKNNNSLFFNIGFEVAHFFTFRKSIYERTSGIRTDLVISEDQDLYFKLYELGNFKFINTYLYFYRIHESGISQNKSKTAKQKKDWHTVIFDACKRRNIQKINGVEINKIEYLPEFIFKLENTLVKRILKKIF